MLVKKGKTLRRYGVFLGRIYDCECPNACFFCIFGDDNDASCNSSFDCINYDIHDYSYAVIKKL